MRDDNLESIVCYAMRYCIGRQTYAVSDMCGFFTDHIEEWSHYCLMQAIKDIDSALSLGDERIDMPEWLNLRARCYHILTTKRGYSEKKLLGHEIKKEYTGENLLKNRLKK